MKIKNRYFLGSLIILSTLLSTAHGMNQQQEREKRLNAIEKRLNSVNLEDELKRLQKSKETLLFQQTELGKLAKQSKDDETMLLLTIEISNIELQCTKLDVQIADILLQQKKLKNEKQEKSNQEVLLERKQKLEKEFLKKKEIIKEKEVIKEKVVKEKVVKKEEKKKRYYSRAKSRNPCIT